MRVNNQDRFHDDSSAPGCAGLCRAERDTGGVALTKGMKKKTGEFREKGSDI